MTKKKVKVRGPSPEKTFLTNKSIINAAIECFNKKGFSDTRMDDVAKKAKLAKGTLYLYYKNKTDLFEGVINNLLSQIKPNMENLNKTQNAKHFFENLYTSMNEPPIQKIRTAIIKLLLTEGHKFPKLATIVKNVLADQAMAMVSLAAEKGFKAGEIPSKALIKFPFLFIAPEFFAIFWSNIFVNTPPIDLQEMYKAYIDMIIPQKAAKPK